MATTQPIAMYKGEDRSFIITVVDENDDRVDLTGYSLEVEVKPLAGDPDPATIAKAVGSGITILAQSGATLGQAQLDYDPADTSGLTAMVYQWDFVAIDLSAERHLVIAPSDFDLREVVNIA